MTARRGELIGLISVLIYKVAYEAACYEVSPWPVPGCQVGRQAPRRILPPLTALSCCPFLKLPRAHPRPTSLATLRQATTQSQHRHTRVAGACFLMAELKGIWC